MALWSPLHKKLHIGGIKAQGRVVRSSIGMLDTLAYHWAPIFDEKPYDIHAGDSFLVNYVPALDFS